MEKIKMGKNRKIPSELSLMICLSNNYYNNMKYINLSIIKNRCGPTENRTRDFCLTSKRFTIKLLAHNPNNKQLNYINLFK